MQWPYYIHVQLTSGCIRFELLATPRPMAASGRSSHACLGTPRCGNRNVQLATSNCGWLSATSTLNAKESNSSLLRQLRKRPRLMLVRHCVNSIRSRQAFRILVATTEPLIVAERTMANVVWALHRGRDRRIKLEIGIRTAATMNTAVASELKRICVWLHLQLPNLLQRRLSCRMGL
jgi:hypothetical protein